MVEPVLCLLEGGKKGSRELRRYLFRYCSKFELDGEVEKCQKIVKCCTYFLVLDVNLSLSGL